MRARTTWILAAAVLVWAAAARAEAPLAEKIPAGALAYVGWAGKTAALEGSLLGELLGDPALGGGFRAAITGLKAKIPPADLPIVEHSWAAMDLAWRHPAAAAFLDIRYGHNAPDLEAVLLIDLGADRDAFAAHLDAMIQWSCEKGHMQAEEASAGGRAYRILRTKALRDMPLAIGYMGQTFFLAAGANTPGKVIGLSPDKSLKAAPGFAAARAAIACKAEQASFFVDVAAMKAAARAMAAARGGGDRPGASSRPAGGEPDAILEALGLAGVTTVAGSVGIEGRNLSGQVRLVSPGPHRGLLMPLAGAPLGRAALAHVPDDAYFALAANVSPEALYAEILRVAEAIEPRSAKNVSQVRALAAALLGLSLADDILPAFGDTWVLASAPSWGGAFTGTLLTVQVKDAAKAARVLEKIETLLGGQTPESAPRAKEPAESPDETPEPKSWTLQTRQAGQTAIRFVAFHGRKLMPVAPAWAIHQGRLYVALWPQVIESAVAGQASGGLSAAPRGLVWTPAYRALHQRVGQGACVLAYADGGAVARDVYNLLLVGWTVGAAIIPPEKSILRQDWLPALSTLQKYLSPEMAAVSADAGGITFRNEASLGGLTGLAAAAPITAVALPAVAGGVERSRRAASAAQLREIGKCCHYYRMGHPGFPPDLQTLAAGRMIDPRLLISPNNRGPRPTINEDEITGTIDYVYVPGLKLEAVKNPSACVLAYERPELYDNAGTNVLFVDGHVEWLSMPRLTEALKGAAGADAPASRPAALRRGGPAKEEALQGALAVLRNALDMYAAEHNGKYPKAATAAEQLLKYSSVLGAVRVTKDSSHPFGPYLMTVPALPVGAHRGATKIAAANAPGVGWIYNPATGAIRANTAAGEKDDTGRRYSEY